MLMHQSESPQTSSDRRLASITFVTTGVRAVTVAVRGMPEMKDISPTKLSLSRVTRGICLPFFSIVT